MEFRNRVKERFAWDNDDLEEAIVNDREAVRSLADRTIAHAKLPAEHPGITLESEVVEDGAVEELVDSENQESREAAENPRFLHRDRASSTEVSHDVTTEEEMEVLVTTEEEMEVLLEYNRENYLGDENFRGEGRFFGHLYATQSGEEDGEDMSPLLENFREDILRMPPTCRRDIYDTSATCRVSCQRGTLGRHVISRQMKLRGYG